jgi:hypothetical protein
LAIRLRGWLAENGLRVCLRHTIPIPLESRFVVLWQRSQRTWLQIRQNQWIHVLLPVLLAALHALGDAPARSLTAPAQRFGGSAADAVPGVVLPEEAPVDMPASPLVPMTAPSGASSAPKTLRHRRHVSAARKKPP